MLWKDGKCFCGRSSVENRLKRTRCYDPKWCEGKKSVEVKADREARKKPKCSAYIGQLR